MRWPWMWPRGGGSVGSGLQPWVPSTVCPHQPWRNTACEKAWPCARGVPSPCVSVRPAEGLYEWAGRPSSAILLEGPGVNTLKALDGHTATPVPHCPVRPRPDQAVRPSPKQGKTEVMFRLALSRFLMGCASLPIFFLAAVPLWDGCLCLPSPNGVSSTHTPSTPIFVIWKSLL